MSKEVQGSASGGIGAALKRHPSIVQATIVLSGATLILLDLWTGQAINLGPLYIVLVLLSGFWPWDRMPFLFGLGSIAFIFIPPLFYWPAPLDWSILFNRGIVAVVLVSVMSLQKRMKASERKEREKLTAQSRELDQVLKSEVAIRLEAEAAFVESQARLEKTQEFSRVMVTHVGLDGRWLKVPPSLCKLVGYSESELLADTFMNLTHPDDVDADLSQCQRIIRGEIHSFELEKRYIRKDKESIWVYLNCSGVYDRDGQLLHFLTYIKDITDRKRVEQSLRDSEKKWRNIMETVPIGIAISTLDGRVLEINTAGWKILGYDTKEEFLRLGATAHYLNPADREKRIEEIRAGNQVFETQFKKKDGTLFWGRCTATFFSEREGEQHLINAYEDITDERAYHQSTVETQAKLQLLNQQLIEQDQLRLKFLSIASHELRTPMAAIKGFIDNMLAGVTGELNDRQSEYLRRAQTSINRLTRLITQLLEWSKLVAQKQPLLLKLLQPGDLVREIVHSTRSVAEAKHIALRTEIEANLPPLEADSDKLEQVLWNLVGNAVKFTPEQGTITISCRLALGGGIVFSVSDTGIGIPQSDLPRVFEQFSGIQPPTPAAKGAQLGLYITKNLVEQHGGRIWVESTLGQGSHFFVQLPLTQAAHRNR